jgi:C-8 sterol isomerase
LPPAHRTSKENVPMGYLFDPEVLNEVASKAVGLPFDDMTRVVAQELEGRYPGHVDGSVEYIFNLTCGFTGMMKVLHGSVTEYLAIFGSATGTEGFSGRYALDIYDFVLSGEMWTYTEARCGERVVTGAGGRTLLPRGQVKGWKIIEGTWMLEYGRGFLPSSLPRVFGDVVWSALDWRILLQTCGIYGRHMVRELRQGKL